MAGLFCLLVAMSCEIGVALQLYPALNYRLLTELLLAHVRVEMTEAVPCSPTDVQNPPVMFLNNLHIASLT